MRLVASRLAESRLVASERTPSERIQPNNPFFRSWAVVLIVLLSVAAFPSAVAFAQGQTSALAGQVTDPTGNGIPGAGVTVTNQQTGQKLSAKTDESGRFNFPQLTPGNYSIRVEAQGFRPMRQDDNVISGQGQSQTVNFTLNDGFW